MKDDNVTLKDAIRERHSVRRFKDQTISEEDREKLGELIDECNRQSGLKIQLICDDPECFRTFLAHYGKFSNANHYIAMVGSKDLPDLEERCGYFGQRIVLEAQRMGLNTCWVAGSYGKGKCKADRRKDEKILCVIAIGYGENSGVKRRSRPMDFLSSVPEDKMPVWFYNGMLAAMMAPTALNQQRFRIDLEGDIPVITAKPGPMTRIDLGIVRYNFEAASGHKTDRSFELKES